MGTRWLICPLVTARVQNADGSVSEFRVPKVGLVIDPGRGKPYQFVAAIGTDRALVLARGSDWSGLAAERDIVDVFAKDEPEVRGRRLGEIASGAEAVRLIARLNALGLAGLTPQTATREVLGRLAARLGVTDDLDRVWI